MPSERKTSLGVFYLRMGKGVGMRKRLENEAKIFRGGIDFCKKS